MEETASSSVLMESGDRESPAAPGGSGASTEDRGGAGAAGRVPALKSSQFEFPFKLNRLLDDASLDPNDNTIVSWLPHGRAFRIRSQNTLEALILPRYFNPTPKFRSIQRQLAIYGFELVKDALDSDLGAFRHPLMIRGRRPELCLGMVRQKVKIAGLRGGQKHQQGATGGPPTSRTTTATSVTPLVEEGAAAASEDKDALLQFAFEANEFLASCNKASSTSALLNGIEEMIANGGMASSSYDHYATAVPGAGGRPIRG